MNDDPRIPTPTPADLPDSAFVRTGPVAASRILSGAEFLDLWQPAEIADMIAADPRLLAGCFKVLAQGSANLDSPETAALLSLAVSKGLAPERAAQIAAGIPPA